MFALGGNDIIDGGSGDDDIIGSGGDDTLDGGTGLDTAIYLGFFSEYTITDNGGGDYTVSSAEGIDTLTNIENIQFADISSTDIAVLIAPVSTTITGTEGNDSLVGTSSDDTIEGLGGDDQLTGMGGNDVIDGGSGDDTVVIGDDLDDCHIQIVSDGVYNIVTSNEGTDQITNVEYVEFNGVEADIIESTSNNVSGTSGVDIFIYNDNKKIYCDENDIIVFPGNQADFFITNTARTISVKDYATNRTVRLYGRAELHFDDIIIDLNS